MPRLLCTLLDDTSDGERRMSLGSTAAHAGTGISVPPSVSAGAYSKLVYRSRAVKPLAAPELLQLTNAAAARNRREALTGLMLYDDSRFYQWLEGPEVGVDRIMGSIRQDPRHTDIEVLSNQTTDGRAFGDWAMKLAAPGQIAASAPDDVLEPPRELVESLRQKPEAAPILLVKLVPTQADPARAEFSRGGQLSNSAAAVLKTVILSAVIPKLATRFSQHAGSGQTWNTNPRVRELADLLIGPDHEAAMALIEELHHEAGDAPPLYSSVFEPAARFLGDLWNEDECSEVDVSLGLCRLQSAVRLLTAHVLPTHHDAPPPLVLIAPEPGEAHSLGATMDSEVLWQAGWAPQCEYPSDDKALQDLLSGTWFDVLDLSLSSAFRRDHWLPRVTKTIEQARIASRNPALVVVVGGRVFVEDGRAGETVGADLASRTARHVDMNILNTLRAARKSA
jgi:hypothetical protein